MNIVAPLQNVAANPQQSSCAGNGGRLLQRKCSCGSPTSSLVECEECKTKKGLQAKLTIGASNDPLEQEADRVADQVMSKSASTSVTNTPPRIQRFSRQSTGLMDTAPASVDRVLASPGRPLESVLRQDMEQRFGHDFSRVRVHVDGSADQSAREVNANAYTVGHNIVFGAGKFAPESHEGRRLIAHELTHVVQQSGADAVRVGQIDDIRGLSSSTVPINTSITTRRLARQADKDQDKYCRLTDPAKTVPSSPRTKVDAAIELVRRAGLHALKKPPDNERALKLLEDVKSFLLKIVTDENKRKHFPGPSGIHLGILSDLGLDAVTRLIGSIRSGDSTLCGLWDRKFVDLQASRGSLLILAGESDAKTSQLPNEVNEAFNTSLKIAGTVTLLLVSGGVIGAVAKTAEAIITSDVVMQTIAGTRTATLIIENLAASEQIFLFSAETVMDIIVAGGILEFLKQDPISTILRLLHVRLIIGGGTRGGPNRTIDVPSEVESITPGKVRIRLKQAPRQVSSIPAKDGPTAGGVAPNGKSSLPSAETPEAPAGAGKGAIPIPTGEMAPVKPPMKTKPSKTEPPKATAPEPETPEAKTEPPKTATSKPEAPEAKTESPKTVPPNAGPRSVEDALLEQRATNRQRISKLDETNKNLEQQHEKATKKAENFKKNGQVSAAKERLDQAANLSEQIRKNKLEQRRLSEESLQLTDKLDRLKTGFPSGVGPPPGKPHGGAHGSMESWGGERNHIPPQSVSKISPDKGPAIWMEKADHQETSSWGSGEAAQKWRARQEKLIQQGKVREAVQMDIDDIERRFGKEKYAKGIKQMLNYLDSLNPADFIK